MDKNNQPAVQKTNHAGGTTLLTIAFVILKLCDAINWSWWWVLSPTLIYISFWVLVLIVGLIAMIVAINKK